MKFHYYAETDSLYIELSDRPGTDTREIASGVVADFDAEGHLVGLDIDHAGQTVDLSRLEAEALPIATVSLASAAKP